MPYRIVRHFQRPDVPSQVLHAVDTLEEAQAHCTDPETSSSTATSELGTQRTNKFGHWFDGYQEVVQD